MNGEHASIQTDDAGFLEHQMPKASAITFAGGVTDTPIFLAIECARTPYDPARRR